MTAKILIFDIETAPLAGYFWGLWKQNIPMVMVQEEWRMLTWSAKWLGSDEVLYDSCHLHGDIEDDTPILHSLHNLLDEADMVIAHNGNRFDVKKTNTRFLNAGILPPAPYKQIDTLQTAKRVFAFTSNRLDSLGEFLGVGRKAPTGGFQLWERCLKGDPSAFEEMVTYNVQDVELLEDVYLALRPWMPTHPNVGNYNDDTDHQCPKCGSKDLHKRGFSMTQTAKYQRYHCNNCGGWSRSRFTVQDKAKSKGLLTNAN